MNAEASNLAAIKRWWFITANKSPLGRCLATEAEIRLAAGPWCTVNGNHVHIFGKPPQ